MEGIMAFGTKDVAITAPDFKTCVIRVEGTAPLVVNKFSAKAREMMKAAQEGGKTKAKVAKEPKNFMACFEAARHISEEGWDGVPAVTFRKAMIDACRLVGFPMTKAKIGFFVMADGVDRDEGTGLVKIIGDKPEYAEHLVRNQTGVADIRARPMWRNWACDVTIKFDSGMFSLDDMANLLMRAGLQCGICEGRPSSQSGGMGWGLFEIKQ
jgi:hypothetical protein